MAESSVFGSPISGARLVSPVTPAAPLLHPSAPAIALMTDLATEAPHVVPPERPIDDALRDMIAFGVRLLLVVRDTEVVGVVTSYDIMGERPIQFLEDPFRSEKPHRHADIRVGDIMTTLGDARPLRYRWVSDATVGEVVALFRARSDTHLLVVQDGAQPGEVIVRGIFSRTRLERQLGGLPR
jgi:CBS-domain-containing membrane protein